MRAFVVTVVVTALIALFAINRMSVKTPNYADRLAEIAKEVNSMNLSWKAHESKKWVSMDINQAKRMQGVKKREKTADFPYKMYSAEEHVAAPASFDSRTQWPKCTSIPYIRDQSACGSCWAFGAVEAMSDRLCIKSGQTDQTLISSEDLLECCHACGMGCDGGDIQTPWEYWRDTGLVSGGLYQDKSSCKPYAFPPCAHHTTSTKYPACPSDDYNTPSCKKTCQTGFSKTYAQDKRYGATAYAVRGASNMATDISTNGPIEGAFDVYEDFLTYKTGVYFHAKGQFLGGHAIKVLGYGTENGVDYWLCANSWNETWGDNGYFKIRKGKNDCGIEGDNYAGLSK